MQVVQRGRLVHQFEKIEGRLLRRRQARDLSEGVDERQQTFARVVYRLQAAVHLLAVGCRRQQRMAYGCYGRQRVHDLMGEYARKLVPRFDLLVVEFVVYVADGDDAEVAFAELQIRAVEREAHLARLVDVAYERLVAVADAHKGIGQRLRYGSQLVDVREAYESEQVGGLAVGLHYGSVLHDGDDAYVGTLHDQLDILLFLAYLQFCRVEHLLYAVERVVHQRKVGHGGCVGKAEGVVVVLDGIEDERYAADYILIYVEKRQNRIGEHRHCHYEYRVLAQQQRGRGDGRGGDDEHDVEDDEVVWNLALFHNP